MREKTIMQLHFESRLREMSVVLPEQDFAIDDTQIYTDDHVALLYDVYCAGRLDATLDTSLPTDETITKQTP